MLTGGVNFYSMSFEGKRNLTGEEAEILIHIRENINNQVPFIFQFYWGDTWYIPSSMYNTSSDYGDLYTYMNLSLAKTEWIAFRFTKGGSEWEILTNGL